MKHVCIKCQGVYYDNEQDDYYCNPCNTAKRKLAAKIDNEFKNKPPKIREKSDIERYNESPKTMGFANARQFLGL